MTRSHRGLSGGKAGEGGEGCRVALGREQELEA